jgi:hypothetical protein
MTARRSVALVLLVASLALAGPPPTVTLKDDKLTAQFDKVPVADALAAIAQAGGGIVRGTVIHPREITTEFDAVPLTDALPRLLGTQNFTLSYAKDGHLLAIVLIGGPEDGKPDVVATGPTTTTSTTLPAKPAFPLELSRAFTKHRPVKLPEGGTLNAQFEGETATFPELLEVATLDDDGTMRAQATQIVLSSLEREARLRRAFLRTLYRLDAPELEGILTGDGGDRFREIIQYLSVHSRDANLQRKATVVLDQMNATVPPR